MSKTQPQIFSAFTMPNIKNKGQGSVNQDGVGYHTIKINGLTNQNSIWHNLFVKINQKLSEVRADDKNFLTKSGSTFSGILFDPTNGNLSTANIGDSAAYCCLQETEGEQRKFLVSLTRPDNPNYPQIEQEYMNEGGSVVSYPDGVKYVSSKGTSWCLAMTASLGDEKIEAHIRTPMILNFQVSELLASIQDIYKNPVSLAKFLVASDGFSDVASFFTKENDPNINAPFSRISNLSFSQPILTRDNVTQEKKFSSLVNTAEPAIASAMFEEYKDDATQPQSLPHMMTMLARFIGSKDDITIAETDIAAFMANPMESEMLLTFVCDGHGINGHIVVNIIQKAVAEFVMQHNQSYDKFVHETPHTMAPRYDENTLQPKKAEPLSPQMHLNNIQLELSKLMPQLEQDDFWDFRDYPAFCAELLRDLSRDLSRLKRPSQELLEKRLLGIQKRENVRQQLVEISSYERKSQGVNTADTIIKLEAATKDLAQFVNDSEKDLQRQMDPVRFIHQATLNAIINECNKAGEICRTDPDFSEMIKKIIEIESKSEFAKENAGFISRLQKLIEVQLPPKDFPAQLQNKTRQIVKFFCDEEPAALDYKELIMSVKNWQDEENIKMLQDVVEANFVCESDEINQQALQQNLNFFPRLRSKLTKNNDFVTNYYALVDTILDNVFGIAPSENEDDEDDNFQTTDFETGMSRLMFDESVAANKNFMIEGTAEHNILRRIMNNAYDMKFDNYAQQLNGIMHENVRPCTPSSQPHPQTSMHQNKRPRLEQPDQLR